MRRLNTNFGYTTSGFMQGIYINACSGYTATKGLFTVSGASMLANGYRTHFQHQCQRQHFLQGLIGISEAYTNTDTHCE